MRWQDIPGWFQWRSGQEEAARHFPEGSRFVEVGNYLGRSLCSLAEVAAQSGKHFTLIGVDTCRGSGPEGPLGKNYHGAAVAEGAGTFAGTLHRHIIACGHADRVTLIVTDSVTAASCFPDQSIEWVHLDARHDFSHVQADIRAWLPKVKAGGWISGDDYDTEKWPEVVAAVRDQLPEAGPWSVGQWRWTVPQAAQVDEIGALDRSICLCTMAIHAPYRARARQLCADAPGHTWLVLTDEPTDFADLPVRALAHTPTGPMAVDYVRRLGPTGEGRGAAAYHDKRFVLRAALRDFETAMFFDADSRLPERLDLPPFPPGLAVAPLVRRSVTAHLAACGTWRLPAFEGLALELTGRLDVLETAQWCHETCYAVTRDGREGAFFDAWDRAARWMQARGVYSGEGGVMGLAAACAGWTVDHDTLAPMFERVVHEGGGPKDS